MVLIEPIADLTVEVPAICSAVHASQKERIQSVSALVAIKLHVLSGSCTNLTVETPERG